MTAPVEIYDAEVDRMLASTADELFSRHAGPDVLRELAVGGVPAELWEQVEEMGLPLLEVPEALGGAGGTAAHVATVLRAAGRHLAQIPLAATATAAWALAQAGAAAPAAPIAVAVGTQLWAVPHGRNVEWLVVVGPDRITVIPRAALTLTTAENLAGEPRDHVSFDPAAIDGEYPVPPGTREGVELRLAVGRAAETAGALDAVLALTLDHVRTREQFGIALARLPVVRDRLAVLAEEVAAAGAAVDVARLALSRGYGELAVAAAKVRTAEAATRATRIAHQLHGAIGVTLEHSLQLYTRRLWAWRDEDGSERLWAERLGRLLTGPDVWQRIVEEAAV
jgi:acyl-CoA dehydrogenase